MNSEMRPSQPWEDMTPQKLAGLINAWDFSGQMLWYMQGVLEAWSADRAKIDDLLKLQKQSESAKAE